MYKVPVRLWIYMWCLIACGWRRIRRRASFWRFACPGTQPIGKCCLHLRYTKHSITDTILHFWTFTSYIFSETRRFESRLCFHLHASKAHTLLDPSDRDLLSHWTPWVNELVEICAREQILSKASNIDMAEARSRVGFRNVLGHYK